MMTSGKTTGAAKPFTTAQLANVEWVDAPIPDTWVLAGKPRARVGELAKSADGWASSVVWECSAGSFRWQFIWEETVVILEGAVKVIAENGEERVLEPGDVAYFAPGTTAEWQIDSYLKKIAFSRSHVPNYIRKPLTGVRNMRARIGEVMGACAPVRGWFRLLMAALGGLGGSLFLFDRVFGM